jgi:hypothetical protein
MMPVAPFLAHVSSVSTGPIILVSSSWQILMKACSGVIRWTPYSSLLRLELDLLAAGGLADALHEALDHAELDVALEER